MKRRTLIQAAGAAAVANVAAPLRAQNFPTRPITLICPWPAGGSTDVTMRALAEATARHLPQPIVVENRPGAGGTLGIVALRTAQPDGHTVSQIPLGAFRIPHTQKVPWDPLADITYIIGITGYTFGVVVPANSPFKTFKDLVEWARANPGKLDYGSTGTGTSPHLTMEELALAQNIKFNHIPYKGSADLMTAILGGQIMAATDATGFAPHVEAGKLRLLVTWGERRTKRWPEVPTLKELGYGIVSNSPYGLGTSKGVDAAIVKILHDAFKKGLEDPKHLAALERYDQDVWYKSSAGYAEYARETFTKERALMEKLGLAKT
jgi:tripartite-type tricarboxylate transporter receptor subunit TctC